MAVASKEDARSAPAQAPADAFRTAFAGLVEAAGCGEIERARTWAEAARTTAVGAGWPERAAAIDLCVGAAELREAEHGQAAAAYRRAVVAAREAAAEGQPAAEVLEGTAALGLGGVLVDEQRFAEAARVFAASAPIFESAGMMAQAFEASRLAAGCHAAAGSDIEGWRAGEAALRRAEGLAEEARPHAPLAELGRLLLTLLARNYPGEERHAAGLHARLSAMLGAGWDEPAEAVRPTEPELSQAALARPASGGSIA